MILEGTTANGAVVPVQVTTDGKVVAEGMTGPEGPEGPQGPEGPAGAPGNLWSGSDPGPIHYTGGSVGIGVTNPGSELSIKGGQYAVAQIDSTGATGGSIFRANQNGTNTAAFGVSGWALSDTSSDALVMGYANNGIRFFTNGVNERARIDTSGRLLVGTTSSSILGVAHFSGWAGSPTYSGLISITRGIDSGSVVSGHGLGGIEFGSKDAKVSAFIGSEADGAWASGDYPGRLVFSTTADGASSPTERLRIDSQGDVTFQGAPIIKSPNGTHWAILVDDSGNLSAVQAI